MQTTKERFVTSRELTFKRMQDTTADDWAIIATRPNTKLFEELPDRLLGALRFLENGVDVHGIHRGNVQVIPQPVPGCCSTR